MSCDETRARLNEGAPFEGETREHVEACPDCREEHSFLLALRASRPQPPSALRDRVLAAFPARRRFRWSVAAWVAGLALASGLGYAAGRSVEPPRVELRTVERVVEKPVEVRAPSTDEQIAVLAVALKTHDQNHVEVSWQGATCTKIRASRRMCEVKCCPVVEAMDRLAKERPDLVELR